MRVAAAALVGVILYGILGGADFGGGIWDLLAACPRLDEQRAAIARAMGPVWEANHVWLIVVIVLLFTAFPPAFAALGIGLFWVFHFVLLGISLRAAAFVFRGCKEPPPSQLEGSAKTSVSAWFPAVPEGFAEFLGQRSEVICLPGSARRAGIPARATALSDWLFCLGIRAVCGGGGSD